ncbi:MAG: hypothetical protein U1B80_05165, partial [Anaerolineaceae bacterium]|nr:hypothetical protein [Anaerolineaceae bacterium]
MLRSWEDAPTEDLWEQFTAICSVVETKNTPAPHFSWQAASAYRIEFVKQELASLVNELTPFSIYIDGIGVFTGATP